jgi:hypothetical protein
MNMCSKSHKSDKPSLFWFIHLIYVIYKLNMACYIKREEGRFHSQWKQVHSGMNKHCVDMHNKMELPSLKSTIPRFILLTNIVQLQVKQRHIHFMLNCRKDLRL